MLAGGCMQQRPWQSKTDVAQGARPSGAHLPEHGTAVTACPQARADLGTGAARTARWPRLQAQRKALQPLPVQCREAARDRASPSRPSSLAPHPARRVPIRPFLGTPPRPVKVPLPHGLLLDVLGGVHAPQKVDLPLPRPERGRAVPAITTTTLHHELQQDGDGHAVDNQGHPTLEDALLLHQEEAAPEMAALLVVVNPAVDRLLGATAQDGLVFVERARDLCPLVFAETRKITRCNLQLRTRRFMRVQRCVRLKLRPVHDMVRSPVRSCTSEESIRPQTW